MTRTRQERRAAPARADDALARVLAELESHLEQLADEGLRALRAEIPAYQAVTDPDVLDDVRGHVFLHFRTVIDSFSSQRPIAREDLLFIRSYAARRLERVSIADFIHAFHAAQHVLWTAVIALATDDESRKAVLGLVTTISRYFDVATTHAAEVYVEAQELHAAAAERVRRDLLEDLLAGNAPAAGPRLDALRAAGLELGATFLVIAAVPTVALDDDNALRGAAAALARTTRRAVQPLTVVRSGEIVVVTPAPDGGAAALAKRVADAQRRLAERRVPLAVGMSTVHAGVATVAGAYREAAAARDQLLAGGGVAALPIMTAFDYLTARSDDTAQRLISPAVARFVREDLERGGALVATLREYAAADLNAKLAAERLHIHVNTAHYRLARIAERTGCDLRSVSDVIELLIASRLAAKAPDAPV